LGNASRDLDAYNRARLLALAVTLNSHPSTINHFAAADAVKQMIEEVWRKIVAPNSRHGYSP
jgi:cell fate (sporulation/competence/biofilm development) regulator YlbF (YheA/YmcA/DUF963 family)